MLSSKFSATFLYRNWLVGRLPAFASHLGFPKCEDLWCLKDFLERPTRLFAKKTNRVWNPGKLLLVEEKHRLAEENSGWMLAVLRWTISGKASQNMAGHFPCNVLNRRVAETWSHHPANSGKTSKTHSIFKSDFRVYDDDTASIKKL